MELEPLNAQHLKPETVTNLYEQALAQAEADVFSARVNYLKAQAALAALREDPGRLPASLRTLGKGGG